MRLSFSCVVFLFSLTCLSSAANPLPELYKKLLPSVVTLHTFENEVSEDGIQMVTSPNGLGSGVIISSDGLIVTAAHVVHTIDALHVEFSNGEKRMGKILSSVPWGDLALVKVDVLPEQTSFAKLGNSAEIEIGEQVFVIGAPLGINRTMTVGYIGGRHPVGSRHAASAAEFFQTDAAINPGNSGGPMFNLQGEIIGIASHIQTQSGGSDGLGFAVTSESVKQLLLNRVRFWSGLDMLPLDAKQTDALHIPQKQAVLIQKVAAGSLAHKIGLRGGKYPAVIGDTQVLLGGDVILSIDGHSLDSHSEVEKIINAIEKLSPGSAVPLEIWRSGKRIQKTIRIPQ